MDKMKSLSIDLETFSDVDLKKCGVYRYAESPNFEILLFAYLLAICRERGICRHFLEQACIYLVVISVFLPSVQGEACHGTLIAHVEDDVIIGVDITAKPLHLGRH